MGKERTVTPADRSVFLRCCREESAQKKARDSIGLLSEKQLHGVLKRWITEDFSCHEKKITANDGTKSFAVADVLLPGGEIAEIQTGSLYPLRRKIAFYMEKTDCRVTLVHPLSEQKRLCWIDPVSGEITASRKSPKKQTALSALGALKPFLAYLADPRFTVWFPALATEEYRFLDGRGSRRKHGSHRKELFPTDLLGVTVLRTKEDYLALFPSGLPSCFTAKEFSRVTHLGRGYNLYDVLAVFCALGMLEKTEKCGRSYLYRQRQTE